MECVPAPEQHQIPRSERERLDGVDAIKHSVDGLVALLSAPRGTGGRNVLEDAAGLRGLKEQCHGERRVVEVPAELSAMRREVDIDRREWVVVGMDRLDAEHGAEESPQLGIGVDRAQR